MTWQKIRDRKYENPKEINMPEETPTTTDVTSAETVIPVSQGVTMENDSADDAVLDNIMGVSNPQDSDNLSSHPEDETIDLSPNEDGLTGEDSSAQSEADDTADDSSESTEENSDNPAELDSEDYAKAVAALKRDGVPRSVIDQMADKNPQDIIDWGLKRAKVQADVDGYGAKVKELEAKLSESSEATSEDGESAGTDQLVGQPSEVVESLNRYESEISEIFGDEAAKSVMSPIKQLADEMKQAFMQQQEVISQLYSAMERRGIDEARGRLGERFSRLSDNDVFQTVVETMEKLAKVGEYENIDDLMSDAYRLKFSEVAEKEAQQSQQRELRSAGQPTATTQTPMPSMGKSIQDREDDALDALLSGKGFDGASAAYQG
tara:strand:+ start:5155 stop:6288 length:1134 start_codon:yes stop_codon:yes gene_type:complete